LAGKRALSAGMGCAPYYLYSGDLIACYTGRPSLLIASIRKSGAEDKKYTGPDFIISTGPEIISTGPYLISTGPDLISTAGARLNKYGARLNKYGRGQT
jgi:hypothetical protein